MAGQSLFFGATGGGGASTREACCLVRPPFPPDTLRTHKRRLVLGQNKKDLLTNWYKEGKLEPSEELGDLVSAAGDKDMALAIYTSCNASGKVRGEEGEGGEGGGGRGAGYLHDLQCERESGGEGQAGACVRAGWLATPLVPAISKVQPPPPPPSVHAGDRHSCREG